MPYGLTLATAATEEPLKASDAERQTGAPAAVHDEHFRDSITAARQFIETRLNRQLVTATWDLKLDRFPCGRTPIKVPKAPLASVSSITYTDASGTSATLATSVYKVVTSREPGEIHLKYGQAWPVTYAEPDVVTVRFVAGYGAATAVPKGIKQAMLLLIDHWFENRSALLVGSISKELEFSLLSFLEAYGYGDEFTVYSAGEVYA